jgi:tetratricopeptide (TPR) repeat protein
LLYDLLAGVPPLHPDVTAERIRDEKPAPLAEDGQGQALPPALQRLVSAMLDKSATARPAGIGAVRAVLEEIRQDNPQVSAVDAGLIQPVRRQAAPRGPAAGASELPPVQPAARQRHGLPAGVVVGGLGVLIALALAVVFLLPNLVQEQGPLVDRARPEPPRDVAPEVDESAGSPEQRKLADAALAKLLPLEDKLKAVGIDAWGGADWTAVLNRVELGDEAYRDRNFTAAATAYDGARAMGEELLPRASQVLADALAEGEAALLDGDRARAVTGFELALAVEADNAQAQLGLARAERLDEVLAAMAEATRLESAGNVDDAAEAYARALEIDEQWRPASEGLTRTRAAVQQTSYEQQMARGYAALSDEDFDRARRAFDAALRVRPGDADAQAALQQLGAEERLQSVLVLEREARELEAAERWVEAAQTYEAALAVDDGLVSARQGLERSRSRAQLASDVEQAIGMRDRFYEASVGRQARAVLERARAVADAGPQLRARADELQRLLELAATTVAVRFQSDNLTQVTIYKVGRLGAFESRVVDLRPGRYVAVGSRDGYRDVRQDFRVLADGSTGPIVVRCEEPI